MSAQDTFYRKTAAPLESAGEAGRADATPTCDPARYVAPVIAHELNNILTIVQGYADRLLLRQGEDPALLPQLRLISEAARRAAVVVREATPANANDAFRQGSSTAQAAG